MDTNIYDCCNSINNCPCEDSHCEFRNPAVKIVRNLNDELCNMKVDLAEIKANLIFLAQSLCNSGCLCQTEEVLLLALDAQVKNLNSKLKSGLEELDQLECILQ